MSRALRIVPLGGLGEVGMNCMALELDDTIVVLDCGVTFPDHEPGVDLIHPNFSYLLAKRDRVKAIILTHGHEDHIGGLPYLLRDIDVPVYGPDYALGLVRERLSEFDWDRPPELVSVQPRQVLQLGAFTVEPYRVTHSIPDSTGLVFRSRVGTLVHSGDFKIDPAPVDGQPCDLPFLAQLGEEGVRVLFSDSTNVDVEGTSGSEAGVGVALAQHVQSGNARVVVSMFGSNIYRLAAALRCAVELGKTCLMLGRSLQTHLRVAERQGLLPRPLPVMIAPDMAQSVARDKLMVIASGSQAEPQAALSRLAYGTHNQLRLEPGDLVILSSRVIPGRERAIHSLIDALERSGVRVLQRFDDPKLHVSGHACRDEQRKLIELVRPQVFVPVHGTYHHLKRHAALARDTGVPETCVIENGAVLEVDEDAVRLAPTVESGRVHIQAGLELPAVVLRDRMLMAEVGIVMITLAVDARGALRARPRVLTRGVVWEDAERDLLEEVCGEAELAVNKLPLPCEDDALRDAACRAARRVFRDEVGFRPLTHCVVLRASE
ncbi:MAG TPA: ribonuclease J [Polyangiales bacterium]|nr:ribonuclease J [Polyangiales bacterium]